MREIAISKFKATCLEVLEDVQRTGVPVRITRFGRPLADVVAARAVQKTSWLGYMKGTAKITGDIVGPVGAFDVWTAGKS